MFEGVWADLILALTGGVMTLGILGLALGGNLPKVRIPERMRPLQRSSALPWRFWSDSPFFWTRVRLTYWTKFGPSSLPRPAQVAYTLTARLRLPGAGFVLYRIPFAAMPSTI